MKQPSLLKDEEILPAFTVESIQMNHRKKLEGGSASGWRRDWDTRCGLGWGAGIPYTVPLNSCENIRCGSAWWGSLVNFDWPCCLDWQSFSAVLCCFRNGKIEKNCQVFEVCACGAGPHSGSSLKIIKYFTTVMTQLGLEHHQIGARLLIMHGS